MYSLECKLIPVPIKATSRVRSNDHCPANPF